MSQQKGKPYDPYAVDFRSAFLSAIEELGKPYPSFKLPNWTMWNQITGGLREREFSILCGPTGVGKTTLLANMSHELILAGVKHYVMSVETGHTDYVKRWISVVMGKDVNQGDAVPASYLTEISMRCMPLVQKNLVNFSLYDDRIPLQKLLADLRYQVNQGCKVAFMDNLNFFLDSGGDEQMMRKMDEVVHALIIFAKQNPIHLFLVMHPKKTEHGRVEHEFDIKGPSTSVQEAHNVILFNPPHPDSLREGGMTQFDREVKFSKIRRRGQYKGRTIVLKCHETKYEEVRWK